MRHPAGIAIVSAVLAGNYYGPIGAAFALLAVATVVGFAAFTLPLFRKVG